ncbi:hypothetical protein ACFIOZ_02080 [Vreelandella sp. F11]|uniref:hypothetical protein n=1 Tax=Vreelandella sp. F11 TaxID=3394751 RepID=UPI0036DA858C
MARKKPVAFVGDSKDRLRDFPLDAKREAGFQIDKIQSGGQSDDFRPMLIQTFISKAPIERFDIGVLIGFSRLD